MELKQSREPMRALWGPVDGFEVLCKRFDEAIIFAALTENSVLAADTLNLLPNAILKTSVFQTQ